MGKERLDKFLSSQLALPRSTARKAIRGGSARVGGDVIRDPGYQVDTQVDSVRYNGQTVTYKKYIYLLMYKPAGVLSASRDPNRETVVDLVPAALRRAGLFPVGRLDRDTTGLLLLTDDGDFAHRVISPKSGIPKSYIVQLDGSVTPEMIERFRAGVTLADGTLCRPAVLTPLTETGARLILSEGRYHEVKRMFGTCGLGVVSLHRESIGALTIPPELRPGECVEIPPEKRDLALKNVGYTFLTK